MSVGPMGSLSSAAGSHLAQTNSADVDRAKQDASSQARQAQTQKQAEAASGVGETAEDQETSERDADGRRMWERPPEKPEEAADGDQDSSSSKDPTGQRGAHLDLSG